MEEKITRSEYIFGKRTLIELTEAHIGKEHSFPFTDLYVKENPGTDIVEKILNRLPSFVKVHRISGSKLDSLVPGRNHQGVVALKSPFRQQISDKKIWKNTSLKNRVPFSFWIESKIRGTWEIF